MPPRYIVSGSFEDSIDWAHIEPNWNHTDRFYKSILVYMEAGSNRDKDSTKVAVHVQGFIDRVNLKVFSTWKPK